MTKNKPILLVCFVIILFTQLLVYNGYSEAFSQKHARAVCLLCRYPNKIWLDFLASFHSYSVYVVVDDTSDISEFKREYPTIHFVQIGEEECRNAGYINMNFTVKKDCTAWEKGLYYFTKKESYQQVWFFEDDVFFRSESDLLQIDKQYSSQDLLSAPHKKRGENGPWHWSRISVTHPGPHYAAMCCAIRASRALLNHLESVAEKHKTLYFLEALFPTEAHQLTYAEPDELHTITFNSNHAQFAPGNLYHPLKDIEMHKKLRSKSG